MLWVTPPVEVSRVYICIHIQRKQASLNQQLHHVNLKLFLKFSHFHALRHFVATISIFLNFQRFVNQSTEDDRRICRNMPLKLKNFVVYFKCFSFSGPVWVNRQRCSVILDLPIFLYVT